MVGNAWLSGDFALSHRNHDIIRPLLVPHQGCGLFTKHTALCVERRINVDSDLFTSCSVARLFAAERFGRSTAVLPTLSKERQVYVD